MSQKSKPILKLEALDECLVHLLELDGRSKRFLSYLKTYPALVHYFQKKIKTSSDLIVAAHIAYGWMPTTLTVLGKAKQYEDAFITWQNLRRKGSIPK